MPIFSYSAISMPRMPRSKPSFRLRMSFRPESWWVPSSRWCLPPVRNRCTRASSRSIWPLRFPDNIVGVCFTAREARRLVGGQQVATSWALPLVELPFVPGWQPFLSDKSEVPDHAHAVFRAVSGIQTFQACTGHGGARHASPIGFVLGTTLYDAMFAGPGFWLFGRASPAYGFCSQYS